MRVLIVRRVRTEGPGQQPSDQVREPAAFPIGGVLLIEGIIRRSPGEEGESEQAGELCADCPLRNICSTVT